MGGAYKQSDKPQGAQKKRQKTNRIPHDLLKCLREEVAPSWEAGRPAYNIGTELSTAVSLVLELVLREHQKELRKHREWLREIDLLIRNPRPPAPVQSMPRREVSGQHLAATLYREVA
jgi:hypothetical protein